ncbi:MAG: 5-formyltetrahydrofolate cyclo-ligase [Eubacteriales bacterium]|nr:5-formyltetrahydrofolate cyclo-ligase [Eubacteriales bacterium]
MTVQEAIDYINAHTWSQWKLGLDRTRELLALLGDPQKRLRFVHVAGSNGKGSTCAMIERILREAGCVTGFYPSPYIEDFRERIQVCGEFIPEEALARITARVRELADSMEDHPTQFELITAIGMVWFAESACDLVVLEVGLGGLYDSTNIIEAPEAAVITNIGLEHTEYLGSTLAEIAANKCGIIKSGSDVVCYENEPEVMEVVRRTCAEKGCRLHTAHFDRVRLLGQSLEGQTFRFLPEVQEKHSFSEITDAEAGERGSAERTAGSPDGFSAADCYRLGLLGEYQLHNAATALTVIEVLRGRGVDIPQAAVRRGLANVTWPARFERLSSEPLFILDGGHNPQCAQALSSSIRLYLPDRKCVFLIGMLADKDYDSVIDLLAPLAQEFVCLTPDSPRALPAQELAGILRRRGFTATVCATAREGVGTALKLAETGWKQWNPVISFGSLYMAGAVRQAFPAARAAYLDDLIRMAKRQQRETALQRRRGLDPDRRAQKSRQVCRALEGLLETFPPLREAKTVFSYAAAPDEVDLEAFHRLLRAAGRRVCFPLCGEAGKMDVYLPASDDPAAWAEGPWGIREPVPDRSEKVLPSEIDVVLVPCVAFDRQGGRCGHGAGYYDRFLAMLAPHVPKILIAFDVQQTGEVAMEPTDIRMDLTVTESGAASCI